MQLLALSDLLSAGVAAAHASVHGGNVAKLAGSSAVASIVGRIVSEYSTNGWLDTFTGGYIPIASKNYLAVGVARALIGMAMNEKLLLQKAFDTVLTDAFANEVLMMFGPDQTIIPGFGVAAAPKV